MVKRIRVQKRRLANFGNTLSERDKRILQSLKNCRLLTTDQVRRLHFGTSATPTAALRATNRALSKLAGLGLLQSLERRVGGARAGSGAHVWHLKTAGAELLHISDNCADKSARLRSYEPTEIFARHTVAVSEAYTRLREMVRSDAVAELTRVEWEPQCWREITGVYGTATYLKPDLYAVTATGTYEDHWFFEVDLDTEAPTRIIRKCEQYIRHHQSGHEQRQNGVFPRVVWIAPDEKRRDCIRRHIAENLTNYTDLFAVTMWEELEPLVRGGGASAVMGQAVGA